MLTQESVLNKRQTLFLIAVKTKTKNEQTIQNPSIVFPSFFYKSLKYYLGYDCIHFGIIYLQTKLITYT